MADWLRAQDSVVSEDGMSWSILTTGPYMDMLNMVNHLSARQLRPRSLADLVLQGIFGPLKTRADGTHVFTSPIGAGHMPMVALQDLGFFARYIFDNRAATSRQELKIASDWVDWDYLVKTFSTVTGKKAEFVPLSVDEWMGLFLGTDSPVANERSQGDGSTTWGENFTRWWYLYRDELIQRDFASLRRIHPGLLSLEAWMRTTGYTGEIGGNLLKNDMDGKGGVRPNIERIGQL